MKKFTSQIIKVAAIATALTGFAFTASAQTWAPPTSLPPAGNVAAPINVSATAQIKNGGLTVGYTSGGFANFGTSALNQHVTIGMAPCLLCGGGGGLIIPSGGGGLPTSWLTPNVAMESGFFSNLKNIFLSAVKPETVYARGTHPMCSHDDPSQPSGWSWNGAGSPCPDDGSGYLPGYTCQPDDTMGMVCTPPHTGGTGGVTIGSYDLGLATFVSEPVMTFVPSPSSILSGATSTISWTASDAASCHVTSTNGVNDWNATLSGISGTTHAGSGSHGLGSFGTNGSYTYYMTCTSPSGGTKTVTANVTVGPSYILDTYGNANFHGYVNVSNYLNAASLQQGGTPVCLKTGVNCPAPTPPPVGGVTATGGVANYVPKFGTSTGLTNSAIFDSGAGVGIGTTTPARTLHIKGGGGTEFLLENTGESAGHQRLNIAMWGDQIHFRNLNSAGTDGVVWMSVNSGSNRLADRGAGKVYIPKLSIGPNASGNGIPMYRLNSHCSNYGATNTTLYGTNRWYNRPLTDQKWCGENDDNLWWNDASQIMDYMGTSDYTYYAGKLNSSGGCTTASTPSFSHGCSYTPTPIGYMAAE